MIIWQNFWSAIVIYSKQKIVIWQFFVMKTERFEMEFGWIVTTVHRTARSELFFLEYIYIYI